MSNRLFNFLASKRKFLILSIFSYSVICALLIGNSWDLNAHLLLGKSTFNYLFSFGIIDNKEYVNLREYNSSSYWTIVYFITQLFPKNLELNIFNLINLFVSWLTLIGFYKLGKILYNKDIGIIFFIILFFYPVFFGHMAINPKDTILAFCHIWIFYLVLYYLKNQSKNLKSNKILWKIGFLLAVGTGIQLFFIVSLFPIFFFILLEILIFKKIISEKFSIKIFLKDFLFVFVIFYTILILFWIDTHDNIIIDPFKLLIKALEADRGWPANMLNGKVFFSKEPPLDYILTSFFFKTPEYIIGLFIAFIVLFRKIKNFFNKETKNFEYTLIYIFLILLFPNIILFINPFPVYDGIRLFIWFLPYAMIIPGLTIYYLVNNLNIYHYKVFSYVISIFFIFHIFIFFLYTPYQYTYLNIFSGVPSKKNQKFVNDYWGVTLQELIKKIKIDNNLDDKKVIKVFLCGVPHKIINKAILDNNISNLFIRDEKDADYVILTNRIILTDDASKKKLKKCIDYVDQELITVKRSGHTLAIFGKKI